MPSRRVTPTPTPAAQAAQAAQDPELEHARALVLAHGESANAYQILNPGISLWFSAAGDAVAGYVRFRRFLVVAGSPVCADARLAGVLDELESHARRDGSRLCYFGAEQGLAEHFARRPGGARLLLGAQPAWDPSNWERCVSGHASLRAQLHRAHNKGVRVREIGACEAAGAPALQRCLDHWLSTRGAPPMHFLVESQTLARLFDRRVFVAERHGEVAGFLVASPVPRRRGWLVEQIIRGAGAVNGTSELLVDSAMRAVAVSGSELVTLGLSPLSRRAGVAPVPTPLWLTLLLGWLRAHGRRFYNFEGLDAFKAKLRPDRWEPVYALTDTGFSPAVLHAIAGAFTGGAPATATLRALGWAVAEEWRSVGRR